MGIFFSKVFQKLFGSKEVHETDQTIGSASSYLFCRLPPGFSLPGQQVRILILGLDNAGKTTILYKLQVRRPRNQELRALLPSAWSAAKCRAWWRPPRAQQEAARSASSMHADHRPSLTSSAPFCLWVVACFSRVQNESDEDIQTIPTIGFNVETLAYKNIKFQVHPPPPAPPGTLIEWFLPKLRAGLTGLGPWRANVD